MIRAKSVRVGRMTRGIVNETLWVATQLFNFFDEAVAVVLVVDLTNLDNVSLQMILILNGQLVT